jgi:hypothetical protein
LTWRATTEAERSQRRKLWDEIVYQRQIEVAGEDKAIIETLGDLTDSRSGEFLLHPDQDIIYVRRKMADAFFMQREGKRPLPTQDALAFPV